EYQQARGRSLRIIIPVTFEEAASGIEKEVDVKKNETCSTCNGSRSEPGSQAKRCTLCGGSGRERIQQRTPFGIMINETTCRQCQGLGEIIEHPCKTCKGSGMVQKTKKIKVSIPAGVNDGQRLRISGEGEPGPRGTPPGDLYVDITLKPHKFFIREGNELIYELTINVAQAVLGDTIEVPTLVKNEKEKLTIKPGTQYGEIYRIKNRGFPNIRGYGKGDMHVIIKITVPSKLSSREKEVFSELKNIYENTSDKKR
ncbi:MAG: DnaJ C-terminal domain-containing protein, partial [Candidatus Thorarchaeota archaeon]